MSTLITLVGCPRPTNHADHKLKVIRNYNCSRSKLARVSLSGGVRCTSKLSHQHSDGRRSGGYQPTLWDYNSIQSLNSEYKEERHLRRAECLIEQVKMLVMEEVDGVSRLELIDDLHWLGISCHFENEITQILNSSYLEFCSNEQMNLYSTSLGFRLLRQHGFHVPQEVFERFMDEMGGSFKANLVDDVKGLLQLYEASFLLKEGEETLERAREFARCILQRKVEESEDQQIDDTLLSSIRASLKVPCHWRIQVPNVRSFIDDYKKRPDMNPIVLELAILDTNILQAQYQEDLKEATRWWKNTCLVQHLPFARDRIVECYSWSIGFVQPRHRRYERIMMARVNALITTMDDVFDVYGTLEELQLFTDTIRRWDDIESIKQLPKYMQLCYIALYNFVNEMAYDTLKERGFNSGTYLRKAWGDLIESYIKEAGWYHSGHKPSLEEYLNNAWMSIGAIQILSHIYFWVTDPVEDEGAQIMHKYHDLVRASSMLMRLADDLGTSLEEVERGDVPKSIQCYMNDNNASEEEARVHVRSLVAETWKRMNEEEESPFCKEFIEAAANLGRMGLFMYQDELDGFGMQNSKVHKLLKGLLFECYT